VRPVTELFVLFAQFIEQRDEYENFVNVWKSLAESETLRKEIAKHEQQMERWSADRMRFLQGVQYPDEWGCNMNKQGDVTCAFRSFYICLAGGVYPCCTVIPSKTWETFHKDPLATRQRWYCICCGARYQTKFGMIVELEVHGNFYYVKADIPPENLEDLRAMWLEENKKPIDPEDLFAKLNLVTPHRSEILRQITQEDVMAGAKTKFDQNAYKITPSAYKTLPHFEWQQIMNFGPGRSLST
jgi:hypothetical protein